MRNKIEIESHEKKRNKKRRKQILKKKKQKMIEKKMQYQKLLEVLNNLTGDAQNLKNVVKEK